MEDHEIIQLYWDRNETAITESRDKYGPYCTAIARNILSDERDSEECVSDTWLHAWNAMPPQRPRLLRAFLGTITRNLSFGRYRARRAEKRGGGETALVLEELGECVSGAESAESEAERRELLSAINAFLSALPAQKRGIFLCRYWYADSVQDIAKRFGTTPGNISAQLHRMRKALRADLTERGYEL